MQIIVNGQPKSLEAVAPSVEELLNILNVDMPDMVSVQLNGSFLSRNDFSSTLVKENDEIDFLYFLGGGR